MIESSCILALPGRGTGSRGTSSASQRLRTVHPYAVGGLPSVELIAPRSLGKERRMSVRLTNLIDEIRYFPAEDAALEVEVRDSAEGLDAIFALSDLSL